MLDGFQQKLLKKAYFIVKLMVQPWSGLAHSLILGVSMRLRYSPPLQWRIQGRGPGGPPSPPPPHYLKVWIGTVLCGSMETPKAKTEPMVPPASSDFWKAP